MSANVPRRRPTRTLSSSSSSSSGSSSTSASDPLERSTLDHVPPTRTSSTMRSFSKRSPSSSSPSALSKRTQRIVTFVLFVALVAGVAYGVYRLGGPTDAFERAEDFVEFPPVTTPVDPEEIAKSLASVVTQGAVSVATQIAGGATSVLGDAKNVAENVGDTVKDGFGKVGGILGH